MSDMPHLVETHGLARSFGRLIAVTGVDLVVKRGEVVGLLGANGAGKTTLIRLLLGLLRPSAGHIRLFGAAPSRQTRRRLGYVPQGLGLWDDLTVRENLAFSARAFGRRSSADTDAGLDAELAAVRDQLARDLPLGFKRRLAFVAALSHEPELLVLDEPTSGVDALARARLWDTIRVSAERGIGVLVTTHTMDEAEQCDRLVIMSAGHVIADNTMTAIIGGATSVEVSAAEWEPAFAALTAAGLAAALVGRRLRVPGGDTVRVTATLAACHVSAETRIVPATFEETFVSMTSPHANPGHAPRTSVPDTGSHS
jgi:ABC-2 type transport system ATP-binding protein/ribosome-dependent ATPase